MIQNEHQQQNGPHKNEKGTDLYQPGGAHATLLKTHTLKNSASAATQLQKNHMPQQPRNIGISAKGETMDSRRQQSGGPRGRQVGSSVLWGAGPPGHKRASQSHLVVTSQYAPHRPAATAPRSSHGNNSQAAAAPTVDSAATAISSGPVSKPPAREVAGGVSVTGTNLPTQQRSDIPPVSSAVPEQKTSAGSVLDQRHQQQPAQKRTEGTPIHNLGPPAQVDATNALPVSQQHAPASQRPSVFRNVQQENPPRTSVQSENRQSPVKTLKSFSQPLPSQAPSMVPQHGLTPSSGLQAEQEVQNVVQGHQTQNLLKQGQNNMNLMQQEKQNMNGVQQRQQNHSLAQASHQHSRPSAPQQGTVVPSAPLAAQHMPPRLQQPPFAGSVNQPQRPPRPDPGPTAAGQVPPVRPKKSPYVVPPHTQPNQYPPPGQKPMYPRGNPPPLTQHQVRSQYGAPPVSGQYSQHSGPLPPSKPGYLGQPPPPSTQPGYSVPPPPPPPSMQTAYSGQPPPPTQAGYSGQPPPPPSTQTVYSGQPPPPTQAGYSGKPLPPPPMGGAPPPTAGGLGQSSGLKGKLPLRPLQVPAQPMPPTNYAGPPQPPGGGAALSQANHQMPTDPSGGRSGTAQHLANSYLPQQPPQMTSNHISPPAANSLPGQMHQMRIQDQPVNLMHQKTVLPAYPIDPPKPSLNETKPVSCHPEVFRSTLTNIPQTQALLSKSRLPLGILLHPFKDLSSLPVITSNVIVRCRTCRTYINPYITFTAQGKWKCNLCYRVNQLPDEFFYDPVTKTHGDPQRRPELHSSTVEFIAPQEYMLRPPQPAVYLFVLDVSFAAVETGYLDHVCAQLRDHIDSLPGDSRRQISFVTFDSAVHFYNLSESLNKPHMYVVPDVEDIFLPSNENLLVNLMESKEMVKELLNNLPEMFGGNRETHSALGPALQAAYKLLYSCGGRVTVFTANLPSIGDGRLESREDANLRADKTVQNLTPATDFYKKLALDCSAQYIAVDLFILAGRYTDIASISCISKYSAGCTHYYPNFSTTRNLPEVERFNKDLKRYLTRKIGFEAVMRIRATKGLSIHTFHGNFFVRSTDLLSLPNTNPDAGYAMQIAVEENLTESPTACFQAALLYTSSKGERRIRVHTICLPVTTNLSDVFAGADQQAIIGLVSKMAVDRSVSSSVQDARDAFVNVCVDVIQSYCTTLSANQRQAAGGVVLPHSLRLLPLYILALLKCRAFRPGSTKLDERVCCMNDIKALPLSYLILLIYPRLYPVQNIGDLFEQNKEAEEVQRPPIVHLSAENISQQGLYLMDVGDRLYLYVGQYLDNAIIQDIFDVDDFNSIPEDMTQLPELDSSASDGLRDFIAFVRNQRSMFAPLIVIRQNSSKRMDFLQHLYDDRSESAMSYVEFLQHLSKQIGS